MNMKHLTFLELSTKILDEEKRPLSADEIWEFALVKGYDQSVGSKGKTPATSIGARIYIDIRDNPLSSFIKVGSRPRRFALKGILTEAELLATPNVTQSKVLPIQSSYLEKDLHSMLAYFAHFSLKAHTKTINHSKSSKKDYGEWIHPDMVGCYFPIEEWTNEVFEFSSLVGSVAIKLYSFELKKQLGFLNLRESFFQTVSNSSWANEAYLVAAKISQDEDFLSELSRLNSSFGIGVIQLNVEDPDASEMLFPARNRDYLDWEAMNKLAGMNSDFKSFLKRIKNDLASKEIHKELYDKISTAEDLKKFFKK